jgi:hypothetical protein
MGILKQGADLVYTFRFIRILTMPFAETDAYRLKIIDEKGNRNRDVRLDTSEKLDAYTPFIRLAFNIKRIISKVSGTDSKLINFAAGLYLIKEKYDLSDDAIHRIIKGMHLDSLDMIIENVEWFILDDRRLTPGMYRLKEDKVVNSTYEPIVMRKDQVRISDNCYPIGDIFGIDIYEATHVRTGQKVYVTTAELIK